MLFIKAQFMDFYDSIFFVLVNKANTRLQRKHRKFYLDKH